jgi:hypothetical protein
VNRFGALFTAKIRVEVSAINPVASIQAIENSALHSVAGQVRDMLAKALQISDLACGAIRA